MWLPRGPVPTGGIAIPPGAVLSISMVAKAAGTKFAFNGWFLQDDGTVSLFTFERTSVAADVVETFTPTAPVGYLMALMATAGSSALPLGDAYCNVRVLSSAGTGFAVVSTVLSGPASLNDPLVFPGRAIVPAWTADIEVTETFVVDPPAGVLVSLACVQFGFLELQAVKATIATVAGSAAGFVILEIVAPSGRVVELSSTAIGGGPVNFTFVFALSGGLTITSASSSIRATARVGVPRGSTIQLRNTGMIAADQWSSIAIIGKAARSA